MTTLADNNQSESATQLVRFFWLQRENGTESFCCRQPDDSVAEVLLPEETATAEELIAELRSLNCE